VNQALRDALAEAGMTAMQLARRVGVAVKTVERWLADPGRVPHRETRTRVAEVLGVSVDALWPGFRDALLRTLQPGYDRELVAMYPFRSMFPLASWAGLLDGAQERIVLGGYTSYFLWKDHPRLPQRLKSKAAAGCEIRFLLGDPESELTRQREEVEQDPLTVSTRIRSTLHQLAKMGPTPGLEARFSDSPAHLSASFFILDDHMIYTPHIGAGSGDESPLFHFRRQKEDGVFDRFREHVDVLWAGGRPVPDVGGGS
jgi:transcriptional regulator with XRE-family HTH domain